jgi:cyclase
MLKVRVIPTLLWKDIGLVKGVGFDSWRRVGPIVPAVRVYTRRDVDELIVLDISAWSRGGGPDLELVSEVADETTVPLTVGGGITTDEQVARMLEAGADKVSLNSATFTDPSLIERCADRFGSQCVVLSIDYRTTASGRECFAQAGSVPTGRSPIEWARLGESSGAGEILLTSIERDGASVGYDIATIGEVAATVSIPVIASGGARGAEDMLSAVVDGGAAAVAAASLFHFTPQTPRAIKEHLAAHGVPVRHPVSSDDV